MPSYVAKIAPAEKIEDAEAQDGSVPNPVLLGKANALSGQAAAEPRKIPNNDSKTRVSCSSVDTEYLEDSCSPDVSPTGTSRKSRAYYNSKSFVLEAIRQSTSKTGVGSNRGSISSESATLLVENPLFSADDAWLVGSNIVKLRNPYCVGNAPVALQLTFWLKVFLWTALYAFVVGMASFAWVNFWLYLKSIGASKAIMPCKCSYCSDPEHIVGKVEWCDAMQSTNTTSFGCQSLGYIDTCIPDSCVKSSDDLEDCWSVTAFCLVVLAAYLFLLHRRNASGRMLLFLTCVVEGVLAGAGTLTWNTSVFLHFFAYHCFMVTIAAVTIWAFRSRWNSELHSLADARGHTCSSTPPAQAAVSKLMGWTLLGSFVAVVALFLIFFWTTNHTILTYEFAGTLLFLAVTLLWLFYEGERLQRRFCPDEPLHFVVSLHVDLFCVLIFLALYIAVWIYIAGRSGVTGTYIQMSNCGRCLGRGQQEEPSDTEEDDDSEDENKAIASSHITQVTDTGMQCAADSYDTTSAGPGYAASALGRRTSFVQKYIDWKVTANKRLTNLSGILVISFLFVMCFFYPEVAATLSFFAMAVIPLTRYLAEKMIEGKKIRNQLTGKWIDRSKFVHEISKEGWVTIHGFVQDFSTLQVDGQRFLRIHTGGLLTLRAFQLPSLSGYLKWSDAEDSQILAINWANGERWTPCSNFGSSISVSG